MPNVKDMAARSGRIIKEDNSFVNEAEGINTDGSRNIRITGSLVPLATISTDTVITAGSTLTLLATGNRKDYKTVRGTLRLSASGTMKMQIGHRAGNTTLAAGVTDMISLASTNYGSGESRVDGEWWDVLLFNNGASDVTVKYAQVMGVR